MIRFHFSSAALSTEILDSRNGGSDLGALSKSQNFREKTEFCLKSALFSADHSRKGKRAEYVSLCTGEAHDQKAYLLVFLQKYKIYVLPNLVSSSFLLSSNATGLPCGQNLIQS